MGFCPRHAWPPLAFSRPALRDSVHSSAANIPRIRAKHPAPLSTPPLSGVSRVIPISCAPGPLIVRDLIAYVTQWHRPLSLPCVANSHTNLSEFPINHSANYGV
jgi:hypothetical protein